MKVSDRIKVSEDTDALNLYTMELNGRITAFKQLIGFCEALELNVDNKALYENVEAEFKRAFMKVYAVKPMDKLSFFKLTELYEIDTVTLNKLRKEFNDSAHEFNPVTFEAPEQDFGIYLETSKEIERYNDAMKLVDAVKVMKKHGAVFLGDICRSVEWKVKATLDLQDIQPNLMWIKDEIR